MALLRIDAALHERSRAHPRVHGDVESAVDVRDPAEVARQLVDVLHLTLKRRLDVVEAAHLVISAVRQI